MKKICTKCGKLKDMNAFSWKKKSEGRRAPECKVCHRLIRKDYYIRNKEKVMDRVFSRRRKIYAWLKEFKKDLCCNRCKQDHVATLIFHHKDPNKKEFPISIMPNNGYSKKRILDEISKCEILCANCHAIEHYDIRAGVV